MIGTKSTAMSPEVRGLEENAWSMWSVFGRGRDSHLIDTEECLAYETPVDEVPYNAVFRFRVSGPEADARIGQLLAPYRRRGVAVMWVHHPTSQPLDLRERLAAHGLAEAEVATGMTRTLDDLPPVPEAAPGVEVFEGSEEGISDWMRLVSYRYHLPDTTSDYLTSVYQVAIRGSFPGRSTHWWGARRDGLALSKVVLHLGAGVAGIYGVATRDEGRGLGLATLLTLTALRAARAQGFGMAVLHATPMAVRLYERMGFTRAADFPLWSEPGRLHM